MGREWKYWVIEDQDSGEIGGYEEPEIETYTPQELQALVQKQIKFHQQQIEMLAEQV